MATVEFLCRIPGLLNTRPIKPMRNQKPDWMIKNANELADFKKEVKECPFKAVDFPSNIAKCVGIRQLYQNGWLVETWQDIFIDANLETGNFTWKTPVDQSIYDPCGFNYVSSHSSETFKNSPYLSQYKVIVKLMHPWLIKIPEGYDILMLPEPYKEHDTFEMPPGIYPGSFGLQELNTILLWKKQGQTFIPAGTPICQLMLIKSEKHDEQLRYASEQELKMTTGQMIIKDSTWEKNYSRHKEDISNMKKEW